MRGRVRVASGMGGKAGGNGGVGAMMGAPLREARENFEREYLTVQIRRFSDSLSYLDWPQAYCRSRWPKKITTFT